MPHATNRNRDGLLQQQIQSDLKSTDITSVAPGCQHLLHCLIWKKFINTFITKLLETIQESKKRALF